MNLAERFQSLKGRHITDEDGEEYTLELQPAMSDADIAALEKQLPCPIPADIRAALKITQGFVNGPLDAFDIGGVLKNGFGFDEIFPHAFPIAHDGYGNYWVVDILPSSRDWEPIYLACHDAPVIVYQCATLLEFLDAFIDLAQTPNTGPLNFTRYDGGPWRIWDKPNTIDRPTALSGSDPELRAFAETLADEWLIVDLRNPKIGDGFAWGRAKSRDDIKRWKTLPMWAYLPKKSLLQRIFGKK